MDIETNSQPRIPEERNKDIEDTNRCRRRRRKNTGVRNGIKLNADKINVYNVNKTYKDESKMDEKTNTLQSRI